MTYSRRCKPRVIELKEAWKEIERLQNWSRNMRLLLTETFKVSLYRVIQKKYPNVKIAISQKCVKSSAPNFAHLFRTKLCLSVLLRAV